MERLSRQSTVENPRLWALAVIAVLALVWRTIEFFHIIALQRFPLFLGYQACEWQEVRSGTARERDGCLLGPMIT